MKIFDIEFDYHVDYLKKQIHLLNLDQGYKMLSDKMDRTFQLELIQSENLLTDVLDFYWYLYETNGIIVNYRQSNLQLINPNLPHLYKEYVDQLGKNRRIR